jgi:hypothetical protein
MAKKAKAVTKKTAKKMKGGTKDGRLATTAKGVGRTLGKAARGVDKVKSAVKKSASGKRGTKKPKIDPEVEATRARNRALWKSQEQEATSIELSKQGTLVDERARVRSNIGMSWSNRKPR